MESENPSPDTDSEHAASNNPPWTLATVDDFAAVDFESVLSGASADVSDLGHQFGGAAEQNRESQVDFRVYTMLASVCGLHFQPINVNTPFVPNFVFKDGRSADISDFRGSPISVLIAANDAAHNIVLKARLSDVVWTLDRKEAGLGFAAARLYREIVQNIDSGTLKLPGDNDGALDHYSYELLRRSLQIGRLIGWEKPDLAAAKKFVSELVQRAAVSGLASSLLWFGGLDLEFHVSDPRDIATAVESLIPQLSGVDAGVHSKVELWRLVARAYLYAKDDLNKNRCLSCCRF